MFYGKEGIVPLEEVQATLRTKELTKLKDMKFDDSGGCLNVSRGRSENRDNAKARS
ncbi:retrovirus-related pol polyprotein from transposon TNT 1-94, partial [Trifolium medium]|nr:retrovirus-related pol polyprotein from transposon TNT 1-94 [Trifolium medium]